MIGLDELKWHFTGSNLTPCGLHYAGLLRLTSVSNYTGTTNQIIQWAACKWGMDEDLLRPPFYTTLTFGLAGGEWSPATTEELESRLDLLP